MTETDPIPADLSPRDAWIRFLRLPATEQDKLGIPALPDDGLDLSGASLPGACFRSLVLHKLKLRGCNLAGSDFTGAELPEADFTNSDLSYSTFRRTNLQRAKFTGAAISETVWHGASIRCADFRDVKRLPVLDMLRANWGTYRHDSPAALEAVTLAMRFDAGCHPGGTDAFDTWAETGDCPYGQRKVSRPLSFHEESALWDAGDDNSCPRPWDMLLAMFRACDVLSDWTPWTFDSMCSTTLKDRAMGAIASHVLGIRTLSNIEAEQLQRACNERRQDIEEAIDNQDTDQLESLTGDGDDTDRALRLVAYFDLLDDQLRIIVGKVPPPTLPEPL